MCLQIWRLKKMDRPSHVILGETRPGDLDNTVDNRGMRMAVRMDIELTNKQIGNHCSCGQHILQGYRNQQKEG